MHWLESLDIALFHFINGALANPFFDWLMPILSGHGIAWFIPLAVAAVLAAISFGQARARLCALMIFLVVALGDPLIVNTIKHAVERPRPFVTLPDARVFGVVGQGYVTPEINADGESMVADKGAHNSMPSAHAANLFAVTMVMFLFYRKSLWVMLPLAFGVAFSRIYNGVHYPSDVLAGAILGAGYAVALALTFEAAWQWLGKKGFPNWHERRPSLLNAECGVRSAELPTSPNSALRIPNSEIEWLRLGYILIFVMLVARWIYIASGVIELSKDEAYQWIWAKHLALSYYSKPPGIAVIQFLGHAIGGDTESGVRFFSPLFAAILSVMLLRFFAREASAKTGFWLLLAFTATPLLGVGTILMTIDPPLVLCWTWALVAGWRAAQPDGRTRDWLIVGLAMGLGFLCKYSAAYQILCWAIFFALWPAARVHLRKPGPWLALLIFLVCTLPVIIWNSQHSWITVSHVAGNAGLHGQWTAKDAINHFLEFVGVEALILNPIFLLAAIWAMVACWKRRAERPLWLFFFCMSAPVLLGHLFYSLHSRILPNWIAPAVPPVFCLMALYWSERLRASVTLAGRTKWFCRRDARQHVIGARWIKSLFTAGLLSGLLAVTFMYDSNLVGKITGQLLPAEKDPSRRVRAWKQTATLVGEAREKLAAEGKPAFIIADNYGLTGLLSFYLPEGKPALQSQPLVYSVDSDQPANQFYFWPDYDYRAHRQGQNAIYVDEMDNYPLESGWVWKWLAHEPVNYAQIPTPDTAPARLAEEFESITDLGEHEIQIRNRVIRRVHLWACYNLK
jgi:4-amino-4-deoxy-L-arabinose transferase-like glycosyltransferase/membrane-associated phospholipid phosphatase